MECLTWFYQLFCLHLLLCYPRSSAKLCSVEQSIALLQFKQLFSFYKSSSIDCERYQQSYPKMMYWKENEDCCSWDGVTCHMATGHVISLDLSCSWLHGKIPSNISLFFPHLEKLNLAFNYFSFSNISSAFSKFPALTHLNLSCSYFRGRGQIPPEISHLSKLVSLDLSYNLDLTLETPVWYWLLQNLTELQELVLDTVDMSYIELDSFKNLSSSLTYLSLRYCSLQGNFPESIFRRPNLQTLTLQGNIGMSGMFPNHNLSSPLKYLDLSNCNFFGPIPASLGNLTQLLQLDLSLNAFNGLIPYFLSQLVQLRRIDFLSNNFIGEIPDIFLNLTRLTFLSLSYNQLVGPIPSSLSELRCLTTIFLSYNSLNGTIPSTLFTLPSMKEIEFTANQLTGSIPGSLFESVNLKYLALSSNNLSGILELHMFAKLKNLTSIDLSGNRLSCSTRIRANSSIQLRRLAISDCNLSEFPDILRNQTKLQILDISGNKIHGRIPNWFLEVGRDSLSYLNLSHNFLTGGIENIPPNNLQDLDLRSNLLQGSLMVPPPLAVFLLVSNNKLTGEIPSSFCNLSSIEYLDLSNNSLNGPIPQCLGNSTILKFLDLRMNNLSGSISQTFAYGSSLTTLNLNGNHLEGPLPPSLVNCLDLIVLDVGYNKIDDTFPHWLAVLPKLQVLILRSNRFHGSIDSSSTTFSFPMLRILDLSRNQFTGVFPTKYFQNFKAMMYEDHDHDTEYMKGYLSWEYYSMKLTVKGNFMEMERILTIFSTIDLSDNLFQGQIPEAVGELGSLKGLNFSHNNLTGRIPSSFGNLTALESLDLSSNRLVGQIPKQLTSLTSLSVLNLSFNQFEGPVPRGPQFNTFPNNSYIGNLELCGFPLSEECSNDDAPETKFYDKDDDNDDNDDTSSWFDRKFAMMGYISGLVIGLSIGYMVFATGRPLWFIWMIERKQFKRMGKQNRGSRGRRN
ncbi:Receptor-like protein [Melia azedarach]|uniref:Receptor-like protein n=1 Tax=Melia azedarach TaxID=155640 RepID=A0ACC1YPU6_MELAZ|nr:Receptor-like protein [Melia azedarach]